MPGLELEAQAQVQAEAGTAGVVGHLGVSGPMSPFVGFLKQVGALV